MNYSQKSSFIVTLSCVLLSLCTARVSGQVTWIESTDSLMWNCKTTNLIKAENDSAEIKITNEKLQTIDGFGACFNELGWKALSVLNEIDREKVIKDLFDPHEGLKLNVCRMPVGANDFARDYYSLDDSAGDFEMKYFSIDRDKEMLIPYIKAAMKYRSDLKIWGSPWTPPAWMKVNHHYACSPNDINKMKPKQTGKIGATLFNIKPEYMQAYAHYLTLYVEAYRKEGINVTGIHVQNEMNSCQSFPSCLWNAKDLGNFIGSYLGPEFARSVPKTEIWYGTIERQSIEKIDTVMLNPLAAKYIAGMSFQWAGRYNLKEVRINYPKVKIMESETECGDGSNNWKAGVYTFDLMQHYLKYGASVYTFWNMVLDESGKSSWGWKQNSLITVNSKTKEIKYHPEFYVLKHFSYFIQPGAKVIATSGLDSKTIAFRNPDKSLVVIIGNLDSKQKCVRVFVDKEWLKADLKANSINTFLIPGK
jgi:glucosylceramidase